MNEYTVIYDAEDGVYFARIVGLPGCLLVGESLEEVEAQAQKQIEWTIRNLTADGMPIKAPAELSDPVQQDCWHVMRA